MKSAVLLALVEQAEDSKDPAVTLATVVTALREIAVHVAGCPVEPALRGAIAELARLRKPGPTGPIEKLIGRRFQVRPEHGWGNDWIKPFRLMRVVGDCFYGWTDGADHEWGTAYTFNMLYSHCVEVTDGPPHP